MTLLEHLRKLATAYFHQDYDLDFDTTDGVIRAFARDEPPGELASLKAEIESVIDSNMTDSTVGTLWLDELDASYDPALDGWGYRQWLQHVADILGQ